GRRVGPGLSAVCGIAGALDRDVDRAASRVAELNAGQRHRGPDDEVVVRAGAFTLGNTRLAIQDPSPAGNQPFWSADRRYVCVFNGEIYNYLELIDEFALDLPNRCDGAVIPELWARLGADMLQRLRGMYAVAVVDTVEESVTLARDPFGIKPLYLRRLPDGTVAFASEVKPLAGLHSLPPVSNGAIATFLFLGSMPADVSPFEGVTALAPNTALVLDGDGRTRETPILPGEHPLTEPPDGDVDLGDAFQESVQLHLRSDVPTVLLLSAGVDSAALAAAAREGGHDVACMTVQGVGAHDEAPEAAAAAAHYGHTHEVVPAYLDEAAVARFFHAMQRPTIDGLNTFVVCEAVRRRGYRVALSGLGGDEALGGYAHYRALPWLGLLDAADRLPAAGRMAAAAARVAPARSGGDKLARLLLPGGPRTAWELDLLQREVHPAATVRALTGIDPRSASATTVSDGSRSFAALVEAELANYLQATLLPDADAFSMCSSVELRVPYLDRRFFAVAVWANGRRRPSGKRALTDALRDPFLHAVAGRPKRGFSVPMAEWLRSGPLQPFVRGLVDADAPVWNLVSREATTDALAGHAADRWSPHWSLVALNGWLSSLEVGVDQEGGAG
ncbi:MAG: asparagine synthase-related protein, partial [Actinomycetota bacterium]|nr:asparagine synthase-related protein [Actinomycetota bacterium]